MKLTKKHLMLCILAALLTAAIAVGGTLAFLTDTATVTNKFTVGDIDIELEEPNYPDPEPTENVPGDSYPKDPTVTGLKGTSYVRLKVDFLDWDTEEDETSPFTDSAGDLARLAMIWKTLFFANANEAEGINDGDAYSWFKGLGDGTNDLAANAAFKYSLAQLAGAKSFNDTEFTKDTTRSNQAANAAGTRGPGIEYYVFNGTMSAGGEAVLFDSVIIPTDWNQTHMAILGSYKIVIQAQAIQAENFADATEAFAALDAEIAAGTVQDNYSSII